MSLSKYLAPYVQQKRGKEKIYLCPKCGTKKHTKKGLCALCRIKQDIKEQEERENGI